MPKQRNAEILTFKRKPIYIALPFLDAMIADNNLVALCSVSCLDGTIPHIKGFIGRIRDSSGLFSENVLLGFTKSAFQIQIMQMQVNPKMNS